MVECITATFHRQADTYWPSNRDLYLKDLPPRLTVFVKFQRDDDSHLRKKYRHPWSEVSVVNSSNFMFRKRESITRKEGLPTTQQEGVMISISRRVN